MPTNIQQNEDGSITVSVSFRPGGSMLESERNLQQALNEAGAEATGECLRRFDSDGSKITVGGTKMTTKGPVARRYQTPYGEVEIRRHVYQGSKGGAIFCPLDRDARIMRTATPLFAMQVSFKYANTNAGTAVSDFAQHGRRIARSYVSEVAGDVASVAMEKEEHWNYEVPEPEAGNRVAAVGVGVDGTCTLFVEEGWKQVMVGTISFYDECGERLATTCVASAPEAGKAGFFARMERELAQVKARYPEANYAGIADGAHDHWPWLEKHTLWQIIDFWHVSEYLAAAAPAMRARKTARAIWLEEACHRLRHHAGGARALLGELEAAREKLGGKSRPVDALDKAISYFGSHSGKMNYPLYENLDLPIGSGVTEAACKSVVKERLCGSGMKWTRPGVSEVLGLRTLVKSAGRWEEFWAKASRFGFAKINHPKRG